MKKMLWAGILLVLWLNRASAEDKLLWSWDTQFRSEYLGKIGAVFYDEPVVFNDLSLSYQDFFVGLWNSTGLGSKPYGSTFGDEFDLYAGWAHTYGWIHVQMLGAYFAIKDLGTLKDDLYILEPEVSFPKVPFVEPYVSVRYFGQVSKASPEEGWFLWTGVRRQQPLGFDIGSHPAKLSLDLMNAYSDGALHKDPGWVFTRLSAGLPITVNTHLRITPNVAWQTPIGGQSDHHFAYTRGQEIVGGISFHWFF